MKKAIVLILALALLVSCSSPKNSTVPSVVVPISKYQALQTENERLQYNYDSLKKASIDANEVQKKYNELAGKQQALTIENALLREQQKNMTAQTNAFLAKLNTVQNTSSGQLETMSQQLQDQAERHRTINDQLSLVNNKQVSILSANLTESERSAFYKGWNLWWDTFNE